MTENSTKTTLTRLERLRYAAVSQLTALVGCGILIGLGDLDGLPRVLFGTAGMYLIFSYGDRRRYIGYVDGVMGVLGKRITDGGKIIITTTTTGQDD